MTKKEKKNTSTHQKEENPLKNAVFNQYVIDGFLPLSDLEPALGLTEIESNAIKTCIMKDFWLGELNDGLRHLATSEEKKGSIGREKHVNNTRVQRDFFLIYLLPKEFEEVFSKKVCSFIHRKHLEFGTSVYEKLRHKPLFKGCLDKFNKKFLLLSELQWNDYKEVLDYEKSNGDDIDIKPMSVILPYLAIHIDDLRPFLGRYNLAYLVPSLSEEKSVVIDDNIINTYKLLYPNQEKCPDTQVIMAGKINEKLKTMLGREVGIKRIINTVKQNFSNKVNKKIGRPVKSNT